MLNIARRWQLVVSTLGLFVCAGCAGGADSNGQPAPIEKAPALTEVNKAALEPKTAEFPKLPKGAGKIDDDAPKELTPTKSGLYYRILRKSDGKKPKSSSTKSDTVVVHYHGWLDDGTKFDSSYDKGDTIEFPLNRVIKGWTEGLQLVGEGGMIELEIPGKLGYQERGSPPLIGPNATLHFLVELKKVK